MTINAPAGRSVPDKYDQQPGGNNTIATASKLGTLVGATTFSRLTITPGDMTGTSSPPRAPDSANYVGLDFDPSEGLIDAPGPRLFRGCDRAADDASYFIVGLGAVERMSLPAQAGTGPFTYDVVVYGLQGATSPDYALNLFLPDEQPSTTRRKRPRPWATSQGSTPSRLPPIRWRSSRPQTKTISSLPCRIRRSRATT